MALTKVGKEGITGISNSSDATAITIDSSERVGIGTTSPVRDLVLQSPSGAAADLSVRAGDTSSSAIIHFGDSAADNQGQIIYANSSDSMQFVANGGERMRITSAGEINVAGKSSNANNIGNTYFHVQNANRGHDLRFAKSESGTFDALVFYHNGSAVGYIAYGDTSTSYNTSSDYRLKENVDYTWDATTRLKQLKPARFNFIVDADTTVDGFLAHEVQDVVPEAITGTKDEIDEDGNPVMQGIDQSKIVPLLVKTIQELEARIAALETA